MKIIKLIIYIIGVSFIGTVLHELYHFYLCGGEFLAGLAYIKNGWWVGATWCGNNSNAGGEIIPTVSEVLFDTYFIYQGLKK